MSVTYEDNNNKEFTNSSHVEGRRKPTATILCIADRVSAFKTYPPLSTRSTPTFSSRVS